MGNEVSSTIKEGNIYHSKKAIINECDTFSHGQGKQNRVVYNQKYTLKIVCAKQGREMRKVDARNTAALKDHLAKGKLKSKFVKEPYPNLCTGCVHANRYVHPSDNKGEDAKYIVTSACVHSCEGPLSPRQGSRTLPHSIVDIAASVHPVTQENTSFKPSQIGSLITVNQSINQESMTYSQKYRVKKLSDRFRWGTPQQHFGGLVHSLEILKSFDPDSKILLKVHSDYVDPKFFSNYRKYIHESRADKKSTGDDDKQKLFVLRFGAVAITPGATVRRKKLCAEDVLRRVHTLDGCHLSGPNRGTMSDIINGLPNSERMLDTFTVDSLNESKTFWSFAFECDRNALRNRTTYPKQVFICDRLKGQDETISAWYPEVRVDDCLFHLIENMEKPQNGSAKKDEVELFKKYVYSHCVEDALKNRLNFEENISTKLLNYMNKSIFAGNSNPKRYCDANVVTQELHKNIYVNERENVRTSSWSESFHFSTFEERQFPLAVLPFYMFIREYKELEKNLQIYLKWEAAGHQFPPKIVQDIFLSAPVRVTHFRVVHNSPLNGIVTYLYSDTNGNTSRHQREIDISVSPLQCTCNCVLRTGIPCMFASVYIMKCGKQVEDFIPKKFTVKAGVEILKKSLGTLRGKQLPSVSSLANLQQSCTRIIPPHSRAPRGRPKSKRITANKRRQANLERKKAKSDEVTPFTNPQEITQNNPNAPLFPDINFTKLRCTKCGGNHNVTKCQDPHDGMGNLMTQEEQNVYLRKGYLIIEIKELGETILPKNEYEYNQMRRNSTHSKVSFELLRSHNLLQNIERSHNVTTRDSNIIDHTSTGSSSQTIPQNLPPLSVSSRRLQSYQFDKNLQSTVLDQSTGQILTTTENVLSSTSSLHGINSTETSRQKQQQLNNQNNFPSWIVHNCEATLKMEWCPKPLIGHLQKICDNKWQFAPVKDRDISTFRLLDFERIAQKFIDDKRLQPGHVESSNEVKESDYDDCPNDYYDDVRDDDYEPNNNAIDQELIKEDISIRNLKGQVFTLTNGCEVTLKMSTWNKSHKGYMVIDSLDVQKWNFVESSKLFDMDTNRLDFTSKQTIDLMKDRELLEGHVCFSDDCDSSVPKEYDDSVSDIDFKSNMVTQTQTDFGEKDLSVNESRIQLRKVNASENTSSRDYPQKTGEKNSQKKKRSKEKSLSKEYHLSMIRNCNDNFTDLEMNVYKFSNWITAKTHHLEDLTFYISDDNKMYMYSNDPREHSAYLMNLMSYELPDGQFEHFLDKETADFLNKMPSKIQLQKWIAPLFPDTKKKRKKNSTEVIPTHQVMLTLMSGIINEQKDKYGKNVIDFNNIFFNERNQGFRFFPENWPCHENYKDMLLDNPLVSQKNDKLKFNLLLDTTEWMDTAFICSYEFLCYHNNLPIYLEPFFHLGHPNKDNPRKPISECAERYTGIVFKNNHFAVIDMLIQYKIVIVIDGLDLDWTKTIQDICDNNLPWMKNNDLLKAHKPSIRENKLSRTTRTCLVNWFFTGSRPKSRSWLVYNSNAFNKVKEQLSTSVPSMNENKPNQGELECINSMFENIRYRPSVIQSDGGFICGFIACYVLNQLYNIDDKKLDESESAPDPEIYEKCKSQESINKATNFRKQIVTEYLRWIITCVNKKELIHLRRDKKKHIVVS